MPELGPTYLPLLSPERLFYSTIQYSTNQAKSAYGRRNLQVNLTKPAINDFDTVPTPDQTGSVPII